MSLERNIPEVINDPLNRIRSTGIVIFDMFGRDLRRMARNVNEVGLIGRDLLGLAVGQFSRDHAERIKAIEDASRSSVDAELSRLETRLPAVVIDLRDKADSIDVTSHPAAHNLQPPAPRPIDWRRLGALTASYLRAVETEDAPEDVQLTALKAGHRLKNMPMDVAELGLPADDTALLEAHVAWMRTHEAAPEPVLVS